MTFLFGKKKEPTLPSEKRLTVNKSRCPQNHPCPAVKTCPAAALHQQGFQAPEVEADKCIGCGKCVRRCPMGALQLQ